MKSYERSISVWVYGGIERGVGGGEDRILVFWCPGEEVHYCHFASSSEFKMKPMLLIVNTLFARSRTLLTHPSRSEGCFNLHIV